MYVLIYIKSQFAIIETIKNGEISESGAVMWKRYEGRSYVSDAS